MCSFAQVQGQARSGLASLISAREFIPIVFYRTAAQGADQRQRNPSANPA